MTRPNIVFIHTDSMDGRLMGCMGHSALQQATPHMDALARRGVLFRHTYTNNPICCPSRASMWSGLYTHHCEGWNNYKGLEPSDPTFQTHLQNGGYRCGVFGKTDYLSGSHTVRARVSPWTRAANILRPNYRMDAPRILPDNRQRIQTKDWDDVDNSTGWLRDAAQGGAPFFLYLGIRAPHPPFITSSHYLNRIPLAKVDIPRPDASDHPVMRYQRINKNWLHGFGTEMVVTVRRIYFAMIAEVDAMLGAVLSALDALNLRDTTYVIFSSDHGEMAMEHRQFYKSAPYEASVRVPLIIAGPDAQPGTVVDDLTSLVDIYPTLMDMARLPVPAGLDGHSLLPDVQGQHGQRPNHALSEYHDSSCNTGWFMLRHGDWKYIAYPGYPPQLFDLATDPDELRDLAATRPDVVAEMDARLRGIVDYEAVDAKAKAYDRAAFRRWRAAEVAAGTYRDTMAHIFSGWDDLTPADIQPWTDADEAQIETWLGADG